MFIRRSTVDALWLRIERLENKQDRHTKYLTEVHQENEAIKKSIASLEETIGTPKSHNFFSNFIEMYYSPSYVHEAKAFTLIQKVEAIMKYLHLKEEISATTQLVKITKKEDK